MSNATFITSLKKRIDPSIKLVDVVSEVLNLSQQGAYKKISGKTKLSLDEATLLAKHVGMSLDNSLEISSVTGAPYAFYSNSLRYAPGSIDEFWINVLNHMKSLASFEPTSVTYLTDEVPFHYLLSFPHILRLKMLVWNTTSWRIPGGDDYHSDNIKQTKSTTTILKDIQKAYNEFDSIEIWNSRLLLPTYHQLAYFIQSGNLTDSQDITLILREIEKLIKLLDEIASTGKKKMLGEKTGKTHCNIYINDLNVNSELILVEGQSKSIVYKMYDSPNYLRTDDVAVCNHAKYWLQDQILQSIPISKTNKLQKNGFIKGLHQRHDIESRKINSLVEFVNI